MSVVARESPQIRDHAPVQLIWTVMSADIESKAARFVTAIMMGDDLVPLLPKLNAWLREDATHRLAFARYQAVAKMLHQYFRCAQPSAAVEELRAFLDAMEAGRAHFPWSFSQNH